MRLILLWMISLSILLHRTEGLRISIADGWTLINENRSIEVKDISIPSGVYSDLEAAGLTESVLFSYNDVDLRWIGLENWTYTLEFNLTSDELKHDFVMLTFNGLDTLTEIYLNGESLGFTDNMFIRYRYNVKDILINGTNQLIIEFRSPVEGAIDFNLQRETVIPPGCPPKMYNGECHVNLLRKMQASFAWDWGLAAPSMGIWKNAFVEVYDSIIISHVTYKLIDGDLIEEFDSYEVIDEEAEIYTLKIFVHIETGLSQAEFDGVMTCELLDVEDSRTLHSIHIKSDASGEFTAKLHMKVAKSSVKTWWPNGYGPQALYSLQIKWEDSRVNQVVSRERSFYSASKVIRIGFRSVELVQEKMDNGLSFYFKVNGVPIFMKGSNWIPSHILPEKSSKTAKIKELLQAARDANMNMLRVWGGGVYESDYFYSLADEFGILIWQDMMFACAMYPGDDDFMDTVRKEVKRQVRRLQYHPSIAIFATNNENEVALRQGWYDNTTKHFELFAKDYKKLYVSTITDEINKNDPSREVLTSSPSNGKYEGNQNFGISLDPQDAHYGDIHFYTIIPLNGWKPETYHQPRFASEYGFQSFPEGWSDVMRKDDNLTALIDHRQHHPAKSGLLIFLIEQNLKVAFEKLPWDEKIYLSQLSQAMATKMETEIYRTGRDTFMNTMGALYWQLNDVWVAPSWSSIEYNGNFKILHHWIKDIFAPQTIVTRLTLLNQLEIYLVSDEIKAKTKKVTVTMNIYKWNDFRVVATKNWKFNMKPNSAALALEVDMIKYLNDNRFNIYEYSAEFLLFNEGEDQEVSSSHIFPGSFKLLKSVADPKPTLRISTNKCDKGSHMISLEVKLQNPAVFIAITLNHEVIKKYRLSRNGFMQFEPIQVVQVTFTNPNCEQLVEVGNFSAKTLNKYLM